MTESKAAGEAKAKADDATLKARILSIVTELCSDEFPELVVKFQKPKFSGQDLLERSEKQWIDVTDKVTGQTIYNKIHCNLRRAVPSLILCLASSRRVHGVLGSPSRVSLPRALASTRHCWCGLEASRASCCVYCALRVVVWACRGGQRLFDVACLPSDITARCDDDCLLCSIVCRSRIALHGDAF